VVYPPFFAVPDLSQDSRARLALLYIVVDIDLESFASHQFYIFYDLMDAPRFRPLIRRAGSEPANSKAEGSDNYSASKTNCHVVQVLHQNDRSKQKDNGVKTSEHPKKHSDTSHRAPDQAAQHNHTSLPIGEPVKERYPTHNNT